MWIQHPAGAGELADFNATVADAYANYRSATFYLRTENFTLATIELQDMSDKWGRLVARFRDAPPDAFTGDGEWRATLDGIYQRIDAGMAAAESGDGVAARERLAPIRGSLGALRRRNQVEVFSDCVNELDAAVGALWLFRKTLSEFTAADDIKAKAAVAAYLFARCRDRAPAGYRENDEFRDLFAGSLESVKRLEGAVERKSEPDAINALRELFSFNQMIFLRFG